MSLFFPELYPGGKKEERERERKGTTVERQAPHKAQTKKNSLEKEKITSAVIPKGPALLLLCFSHFKCFKKHCPVLQRRAFGLEMPVRTGCLNAELMLPSGGLWIWGLLSTLLLAGQSGACPPHCSCTGTTVDCHGLAFKNMPRNIPKNTERL